MLNEKARDIFRFILRSSREKGFPPTVREIGDEFGISSTNGARYFLGVLERESYIRRTGHKARAIEIPDEGLHRFARLYGLADHAAHEWTGIPILGRVAAGAPLTATENVEGRLDLDDAFPSKDLRFALRVRGDSMRDAGILNGDLVVVRKTAHADNGDVVVVLIGDEATVKTYRRYTDRVELQPANPQYRPIVIRAGEEFGVLGVVLGLVRPATARPARQTRTQ
jgi:repressor LexA